MTPTFWLYAPTLCLGIAPVCGTNTFFPDINMCSVLLCCGTRRSSGANDEWVVSVVGAGTAGDQSNSHTVYDVRVVAGKRELAAARPRFSELHNLDKTVRMPGASARAIVSEWICGDWLDVGAFA